MVWYASSNFSLTASPFLALLISSTWHWDLWALTGEQQNADVEGKGVLMRWGFGDSLLQDIAFFCASRWRPGESWSLTRCSFGTILKLKNFISIYTSECFRDLGVHIDFDCGLKRTGLKSGFINLRISQLLDLSEESCENWMLFQKLLTGVCIVL